jgi:hypothetical protein
MLAPRGTTITQNGYIREYDSSSIVYKTLVLDDIRPTNPHFTEIKIGGKGYFFREEIVFSQINIPENYSRQISSLLTNEPVEIPGDPVLFRIWQLEYIEKGLRDY